ncbi:MAG: hypothetical protein ACOYKE_07345 [Ferruginibacter sp.]
MLAIISAILGYLASVLLAISLLVNHDLKFRWLNTFGCLSFIAYGAIIHAFPIILTNGILLLINVYYLIKIYRTQENFDLVEIKSDDQLIHKFLLFYERDILSYFPKFFYTQLNDTICFVVLRDIVIANIFAAKLDQDGSAIVDVNYTVDRYRDYKVGKYLFEKEKSYLLSKGANRIVYLEVSNANHEKFLKKMGFEKQPYMGSMCYMKSLL